MNDCVSLPCRIRRLRHPLMAAILMVAALLGTTTLHADDASNTISQIRSIDIPGMKQPCRIDLPILNKPDHQILQLSLIDTIHRALKNNLDIRVSGIEPAISLADVTQAQAAFDAVLFGSVSHDITDQDNLDSGYYTRTVTTATGEETLYFPTDPFDNLHDSNYSMGLRKRLPTGASIQLAQTLRRYRDLNDPAYYLNPFYEQRLSLELRQPLLRDFGLDVNRAEIHAARNQYQVSRQEFQQTVIQTAIDVESNYWRLAYSRLQIAIYKNQLEQAQNTLERLQKRIILDAASGILARNIGLIERAKANLIAAQNGAIQQQNRLLESINDPDLPLDQKWEIILTDLPTTQSYTFDRHQSILTGLQIRPEIVAEHFKIDTQKLALAVAENQTLPRLDLVAQQNITGAGDDVRSSLSNQDDMDAISYRLGFNVEIPLGGNRAAQATLTRAKHRLRQEQLRLKNYQEQVTADVNIAVTALESAKEEIDVRRSAVAAEFDILRSYEAQEDAEATITADFLNRKIDAIDRLASVQLQLAGTLLQYNVAISDVHRARGTLLRHNNIKLEELP